MITVSNVVLIGGPQAKVRGLNKSMKSALQSGVRLWHSTFLLRHFKQSATGRYKYRPRSRKYQERKRRKTGQAVPFVWTGATRDAATRFALFLATGRVGKVRAEAKFVVPSYITRRRRSGNGPDLRKELLAVHPSEVDRIQGLVEKRFMVEMKKIKPRRKVRV